MTMRTHERLLRIYLRDHLARALSAAELARRSLSSNRGTPFEADLSYLCEQAREDREALEHIAAELGVSRSRGKEAAVWLGERLGRLKLNGRLVGYSPLSRVVELEGLEMLIESRRGLWQDLRVLGRDRFEADLEALLVRAESQLERVRAARQRAARAALTPEAHAGEASRLESQRGT